jgi:hypothetical protein
MSKKQKFNAKTSSEAELFGAYGASGLILWMK